MQSNRFVGGVVVGVLLGVAARAAEPVNLAPKAKVTASSEYSDEYRATWAVDGKIPLPCSRQDSREAWCVRGAETKCTGEFTLTWPKPTAVAEIVYYGRTGQIMEECFKDYEVYLDDATEPAVRGVFEKRHGAQRIKFPRTTVEKIRIAFLSAYTNSANPGASEIAVFGGSPTDDQIHAMTRPPAEQTSEALALRKNLLDGKLNVDDILVIKRYPLNISHVYVYHVEGFQKGGGLYVFSPDEQGGKFRCLVDSTDGMISTADLSYDGKQVVFA